MIVYAVIANASTDCGCWPTKSIWTRREDAEAEARALETVTLSAEVKEFQIDPAKDGKVK